MYAVVGCSDCSALWVVDAGDRPETTSCPRCGKRRQFDKLKRFVETDNEAHAREVRASMLAARSGHSESFAEVDSFAELDGVLDDIGVSDEEYLEGAGVDTEAVAAAADRADRRSAATGGTDRVGTVRKALRELDDEAPDAEAVVAYAGDRGIDRETARAVLDRLVDRGEVLRTEGGYRPV